MPAPPGTGEVVLTYDSFGPQAAAHELIGMRWWQWQSHGDSRGSEEYSIKVVVYWGQDLEAVERQYPVNEAKEIDYRYVEYDKAVSHMEAVIEEFEDLELPTESIASGLEILRAVAEG